MDKVHKRVFHWSNRLLSLQRRIVLVKHVLKAIPVNNLMALTLNQAGYTELEKICRVLWGLGETGHANVPLVIWATIPQSTLGGGLGLRCFQAHAQILKLWCAAQILQGSPLPGFRWLRS